MSLWYLQLFWINRPLDETKKQITKYVLQNRTKYSLRNNLKIILSFCFKIVDTITRFTTFIANLMNSWSELFKPISWKKWKLQITKGQGQRTKEQDVLNYLDGVENDVGTILKNGKFCTWVHLEEWRVHVLGSDRIDMIRRVINASLFQGKSHLLAVQGVWMMI